MTATTRNGVRVPLTPDDERALRIGRWVMECATGPADGRVYTPSAGHTCRADVLLRAALAAGDNP